MIINKGNGWIIKEIRILRKFLSWNPQIQIFQCEAYMLSVKLRRIRTAIALPLLLGFATLYQLKDTTYLAGNKVKK